MSKKHIRSEYKSYQPNSPLTLHYISTGAILPEKEEAPRVVSKRCKRYSANHNVDRLKKPV